MAVHMQMPIETSHISREMSVRQQQVEQIQVQAQELEYVLSALGPSSARLRHALGPGRLAEIQAEVRAIASEAASPGGLWQSEVLAQRMASLQLEVQQAMETAAQNQQFDGEVFAGRMPIPAAQVTGSQMGRLYGLQQATAVNYLPAWRNAAAGPSLVLANRVYGEVALPPEPHDAPLDVNITIERNAEGTYRGFIECGEGEEPELVHFRIEITRDAVARWNRRLRQSINSVLNTYGMGTHHPLDKMRADLAEPAKRGATAAQKIFGQETLDLIVEHLERSRGGEGEPTSVQIQTEDFYLPWEMLYTAPGEGEEIEAGFWGFRYNICRTVLYGDESLTKRVLIADHRPDVLLLTGMTDPEKPGHRPQKEMLQDLEDSGRLNLFPLPELEPEAHEQEMAAVRYFNLRKAHLIHVGCHAHAQERDLDAYFQVDREFDLHLGDLVEHGCVLHRRPVVLLNACNTGVNPRSTADFVRVFLRDLKGSGVIATEYDVPETFAVEFARKFYQGFLAGQTVGQALLAARRTFLEEEHNPLGLLYSAYVDPETRLDLREAEGEGNDLGPDTKEAEEE